ncbi:MAG TPA: hypothetical protein VHA10_00120 [Hypericibacter adhaerens]|jgi:hypothetical protein|uniref:Holin-X, holin superfamily III n=1 Tax=Hypericibacter adhaerens TaxID=2602016 RepID=A0A5J6N1A5_9PROT|nr:hypothetical protein [Hypericibacter adhaerens]QEX23471.1 hypothetical protein FRZ61_34090 [Hypericibacter adhaerens]HWA41585.1 hypothetical protein [Hypericibacter adhaerens]
MTNLDAGLVRLLMGIAVLERAEAAKRRVKKALAWAAIGLGVALAAGGTAVLTLGELAVHLLELPLGRGNALIVTAAGFAILAVGGGYLAWVQLLRVLDPTSGKKPAPAAGSAGLDKDPLWNLAGALAVGIVAGASRGRD